ncbi:HNH endonuclease [Corynebacterium phoceense]|uniref:HNH endonuclease n=1 Tax=Corynebacterium phoceense TaxID=1686286 RepID=A0A540R857_9CORY|nr:hypothetical protein [Corynebacterium phoceense]TQE43584.1 HNH endonuclease [Corynebacterium phoceense]
MDTKLTTAQRGYGGNHAKAREQLIYNLIDGTPCEYCGQPMYREAGRNFDGAALEADHEEGDKTRLANRLLHRRCNRAIANEWVKHGPGWYQLQVGVASPIDWPGGRVIGLVAD